MNRTLSNYLPGLILFTIALIVGLIVYTDYGISWDEVMQRRLGQATYAYVFENDNDLFKYDFRYYGSGFELPLVILERKLNLTNSRDVLQMRHLVTHIFFLLAALAAYALAFRLFHSRFLACIGFLMLLTEPRLYAHSFFNSKDIPFMSAVMIALFVAQLAFERDKSWYYALLGVVCGYATSIRIMGLMLAAFVMVMLAIDFVFAGSTKREAAKKIAHMCSFAGAFCLVVYICWPYLWSSPVTHLTESFNAMSVFQPHGGSVFFKGSMTFAQNILPDYIATWFSITTPLLWLCAGLAGMLWIVVAACRRPLMYFGHTRERNFLLYVVCFATPVLAIIVLHSIIYDDWRHLYFIYPSFMLMALFLFDKLMKWRYGRIVQGVIALQVLVVGVFMVRNHPYQQVYFSELVLHKKGQLRHIYELDYWGASFKQGLERIIQDQPTGRIKVSSEVLHTNSPLALNILQLPVEQRQRIEMVNAGDADYFITNFRGHHENYPFPIMYHINVCGDTILAVYKRPQ